MGSPIPEDLLFDILVNLPVESLMRLRWVCKDWYSLIHHTPAFAKAIFKRSNKRLVFAFQDEHFQTQQFFVSGTDGDHALHILSLPLPEHYPTKPYPTAQDCRFSNSIDGLICFNHANDLYICNPSIPETIMLPPTTFDLTNLDYLSRIYMGYDSNAHSYKVLHVRTSIDNGRICGLEILTIGTESWRRLEGLCAYHLIVSRGWNNDGLINGAVHWEGIPINKEDKKVVVGFEIAEEQFELIPLPTGVRSIFHKAEHEGQLLLINCNVVLEVLEAWVMKEEYEEKKKKKKEWVLHWWGDDMIDMDYLWPYPADCVRIYGREDGEWSLRTIPPFKDTASFIFLEGSSRTIITAAAYVESIYSLREHIKPHTHPPYLIL